MREGKNGKTRRTSTVEEETMASSEINPRLIPTNGEHLLLELIFSSEPKPPSRALRLILTMISGT